MKQPKKIIDFQEDGSITLTVEGLTFQEVDGFHEVFMEICKQRIDEVEDDD